MATVKKDKRLRWRIFQTNFRLLKLKIYWLERIVLIAKIAKSAKRLSHFVFL